MTLSRTLQIGGRDALLDCKQDGRTAEITVTFDGESNSSEARRLVLGARNWAKAAGLEAHCSVSGDQLVIDAQGNMLELPGAIDRIERYLEEAWTLTGGQRIRAAAR